MTVIQIFTTIVNVVLLLMVFDFLRRERLKEKYSIMWVSAIVAIQLLILFHEWLNEFSLWVGVYYPPSLLFYLAFLFLFIIVLHLSLVVSKLTKQNQIMAQKLALLEAATVTDAASSDYPDTGNESAAPTDHPV